MHAPFSVVMAGFMLATGFSTLDAVGPDIRVQGGVCTVFASDPFQDGRFVGGEGSQTCSGDFLEQQVSVVIQQHRALGLWRDKQRKTSAWSTQDFIDIRVFWECRGSGSQLYRIITDGKFRGADGRIHTGSVQSENPQRFEC